MSKRTPQIITEATQSLLYVPPQQNAELGLILGNRSVSGYVAEEAARLYHAGRIQKVAISGGLPVVQIIPPRYLFNILSHDLAPNGFREKECDLIRRILLKQGVPDVDIVAVENRARNTGQNIQNLQSLLTQFNSVNIVTVAYHQARAHATFRRWIDTPSISVATVPVYPFHIPREEWIGDTSKHWARTSLASIVWGEFDKINPQNPESYLHQGFCVPFDPYESTKKARPAPVSGLPKKIL